MLFHRKNKFFFGFLNLDFFPFFWFSANFLIFSLIFNYFFFLSVLISHRWIQLMRPRSDDSKSNASSFRHSPIRIIWIVSYILLSLITIDKSDKEVHFFDKFEKKIVSYSFGKQFLSLKIVRFGTVLSVADKLIKNIFPISSPGSTRLLQRGVLCQLSQISALLERATVLQVSSYQLPYHLLLSPNFPDASNSPNASTCSKHFKVRSSGIRWLMVSSGFFLSVTDRQW